MRLWMWNAGEESGWYTSVWFDFWVNEGVSIQENKGCRRKNEVFLRGFRGDIHMCSC